MVAFFNFVPNGPRWGMKMRIWMFLLYVYIVVNSGDQIGLCLSLFRIPRDGCRTILKNLLIFHNTFFLLPLYLGYLFNARWLKTNRNKTEADPSPTRGIQRKKQSKCVNYKRRSEERCPVIHLGRPEHVQLDARSFHNEKWLIRVVWNIVSLIPISFWIISSFFSGNYIPFL